MNTTHTPISVGSVMTPDPITVRVDEAVQTAAWLLEENAISGLPVVDGGGAVVGVIGEGDLVRARSQKNTWRRWQSLTVRQLMHAPVITADPDMGLQEAAALMEASHVHRLIVVSSDQQTAIGVISASDLVRAMVGEQSE